MNGTSRVGKPLVEVEREFVGCRLETQVLIQAYLLAVPEIRRPTASTRASWLDGRPAADKASPERVAQGA